jgi:hypothetical protein
LQVKFDLGKRMFLNLQNLLPKSNFAAFIFQLIIRILFI